MAKERAKAPVRLDPFAPDPWTPDPERLFPDDWVRDFVAHLMTTNIRDFMTRIANTDYIYSENLTPYLCAKDATTLVWSYQRQYFIVKFDSDAVRLPPVSTIANFGSLTPAPSGQLPNEMLAPATIEVCSLPDAFALVEQVEGLRQQTWKPLIRLDRRHFKARIPAGQGAHQPPQGHGQGADDAPALDADAFLAWVRQGIVSGDLPHNSPGAFVHFVPEGMLLITPRVFREYLGTQGVKLDGSTSWGAVKHLQKLLQKSGSVALASKHTYLHVYRAPGAKNPHRDMMTGYLVPNTPTLFNPVPEINLLLERFR
jgi:hypothetical protein